MFQLGVITDEVSQNLREAAIFAKEYGLTALELRSVNERGPFQWTMEDAKAIKAIADEFRLSIAAISSPLFKCDITDEETIRQHIEGFRRCALDQIEENGYAEKFALDGRTIIKLGINFSSEKRNIDDQKY